MPLAIAEDTNGAEHNTHTGCYASVADQCNGAVGCSEEDYSWGLDQCERTHGRAQPAALTAPAIGASAAIWTT